MRVAGPGAGGDTGKIDLNELIQQYRLSEIIQLKLPTTSNAKRVSNGF